MADKIKIESNIPIPKGKSKMPKKYIFSCGFCGAKLNTQTGGTSLPEDSDAYSIQKLKLRIKQLEDQLAKLKPGQDPDSIKKEKVKNGEEKRKGSEWF